MPITAVCPECQTDLRLRDELAGKSMRCPVCQEVFVVRPVGGGKAPAVHPPPRPRTDIPTATYKSGTVTDFVPLITDATAVPAPKPAPPRPRPRETQSPPPVPGPSAADFPWDEGPRPKTKAGPREMTWAPDVAPPPLPRPAPPPEREYEADPAEPEFTRPKKKTHRRLIVGGMAVLLVVLVGAGGYAFWRYKSLEPERYFDLAHKEYTARQFQQARAHFDKLVADHPNHRHAAEARFFSELCQMRQVVGAVTTRDDPAPAVSQWQKFETAIQDPTLAPFAAPDRFGLDVWEAGSRLAEDILAKANADYQPDNPAAAEAWLKVAVAVDAGLDRFRPKDVPPADTFRKDVGALRAKITGARDVLALVAEVNAEPDPAKADQLARRLGVENHSLVVARRKEAEQAVQALAKYTREPHPKPPTPAPDDTLRTLLFAPAVGPVVRRAPTGPPGVFFALARGVLYVLDEIDGHVLWAARTGLDMDVMPVRVKGDDRPDLALIATNAGDQFGLTARATTDGAAVWHQPLPAPCRGTPVVVGPHAYVALGDAVGTVLEINVASGEVVGTIALGRPVGPQMAARPGTGLLYVPADAQATYVFDVDARGPNGDRRDPALLGVMNTGHPTGTLRGTPVFSNPEPDDPGPKFLVLGQADGLDSMKLRAFPVPADGKPNGGDTAAEIGIGGWAAFPPFCDGEKLAVVTDRGEFGLYGLALANNPDPAIFAFPSKAGRPANDRPSRGQVVLADEGTFWVLVAGSLRKLRFGISGDEGVRLVPAGEPIPAGEPLHAPQVNARGDVFVVVTQDGPACRATAVDARSGQVRWRRDLGMIAKGDPLRVGDAVLLLDQAGAVYRIGTADLARDSWALARVDEKETVFGPPAAGFAPITGLIPGPDGTAFVLLANDSPTALKLVVRKYGPAGAKAEAVFPVRALPAGRPIVSGAFLILPLADGTLYRTPLDTLNRLEDGPGWRGERQPATVPCYLTAIDEDELFASDGGRTVRRWRWESKTKAFDSRGKLTLPERVVATPVVLPGNRLVVADAKGNVLMWDGDKLAPPAVRAWRPGETKDLPTGPITDGLYLVRDADDQARILYAGGGQYVLLSPNGDAPRWVGPPPVRAVEGRPMVEPTRITITDRAGVVRVLEAATGKPTGEEYRLSGSHAFAAAALPLDGGRVLVPLADGTVVLGVLQKP